ncbi:hypothetical protein C7C45_03120 [Micromonospora arborensis]|uniref:Uncharacterized protein n=1 Tax=Micromonospora arborensis TaxID=2116518 RepID=A0A318NSM5_9ACTN|nr:hypothetical protein [Micromonospora arborensis]PYC74898.1 hypothetical protein C7C45_03120 [Micromonospora arborensis]
MLLVLGALAVAVPGALGWFVGEALGGQGEVGLAVVYGIGVLLWALLDEHTGEATFTAILAFVLGLPIVYVVVVGVKLLVLALGLADLSARDVLLSSLLSALAGTGISVGLSLVGAFKRAMEPSAGRRSADLQESFLSGLSFRMPLALLIAGLMDLPETPAARVVTGTAWGVAAAVCAVVYTWLVDREPIRRAWFHIVVVQVILLACGLFAVIQSLGEADLVDEAVQLAVPASASCGATYLLTLLGATAARLLHRHAPDPCEPSEQ